LPNLHCFKKKKKQPTQKQEIEMLMTEMHQSTDKWKHSMYFTSLAILFKYRYNLGKHLAKFYGHGRIIRGIVLDRI